jgi:fibronectin-binding autotransporter adhesin
MNRGTKSFRYIASFVLFLGGTGFARAQSIAVHWSDYYVNFPAPIPAGAADGIQLPDGSYNANWTNIEAGYDGVGSSNNTNLQDSTGAATTAAVGQTAANSGTYYYSGTYTAADNLLNGPWGGNGPIANVITGIPYSSYEVIGYLNPPYGYGTDTVWLDSNPASSNGNNTPVAGSQYYFSPDSGSGTGSTAFVLMTNNTSSTSFPAGNTVVWTGLTGPDQTLWTTGFGSGGSGNNGFTGFEIFNTAPATPPTWAAAVNGNWSTAANWTGGPPVPPNAPGVTAVINASTSAAVTITLDEPVVIGNLLLGSGTPGLGYTLSGGGSNTLTFSSAPNSQISVTDGTHYINAPVIIVSNLVVTSTSSNPWTLTFGTASSIADNGNHSSLTMNAANGTLVLSGQNTYSGNTLISQGVLQLGSNQAIQNSVFDTSGAGSLAFSAGVSSPTFGGIIGPNTLTLPSQVAALTLNVAGGTQSYPGNLIASATTFSFTKTGPGMQVLSGANSYTGGTSVNNGTLVAASAVSLPVGPSNPVSVAPGASLIVQTSNGFGGWSSSDIDNLLAYTTWGSSAAVLGIDTTNGDFTYGSNITQALSLTKLGANTLVLTGSNTSYPGATIVSAGSLQLGDGTAGDDVSLATSGITNNAALVYNVAVSQTGSYAISGNGSVTKNGNGMLTLTGANSYTGPTNVNAGGVNLSGGTLGTFNHNTGAGTSTIGAGVTVATVNVNDGTVNFNSTQANGTLALPAGSTGTVIVGPASGGRLPTVAYADFSQTPATGTVNAASPLAITSELKLPAGTSVGGTTVLLSNGTSFTAKGANLANVSTPSTLSFGGGKLTIAPAEPSIGLHWSGYYGNATSPLTGTDGVMPQSNWTNVGANWYAGGGYGSASNLIDSTGAATTAAVTTTLPTSNGSYWGANGPAAGISNLLEGPGGGNGGQYSAITSGAIPNVITGIPYTNYEIIAYVNALYGAEQYSVWLDSNPAGSNPLNAPVSGSQYYYGATTNNPVNFVQMTNNSNPAIYNQANYVVYSGLSGSSQTLWTEGWASGGTAGVPNDSYNGEGITSFQIVNTTPASVDLPATAISVTSSSTLDLGEIGTPSLYHTLGALSLTAGTAAGGTALQLQNGMNINFNGISATYPPGGTGAATASIVNGSTSPVISLASSSSVNVDPNVTLTIGLTIGDQQSGPTALTEIGGGTLVLAGSNTYTGGTDVERGTLIVTNAYGLENGTSLIVGPDASSIFAPAAAAVTPVPEPATLALLAAAVCGAAVRRFLRRRA